VVSGVLLLTRLQSKQMPLRRLIGFDKLANVYFITTTVMNYDNVFSINREYSLILINSLKFLLKEHRSKLFAYVIMPSHMHLLLYLPEGESLIDYMRDFKKFTSVEIRKLAEKEKRIDLLKRLERNSISSKNQRYKLWMDRYDELIITSERMLKIKINYIHFNPVKAGLVEKAEDWEFSSARNYYLDDHSIFRVCTDWRID
jgi:putative transposase